MQDPAQARPCPTSGGPRAAVARSPEGILDMSGDKSFGGSIIFENARAGARPTHEGLPCDEGITHSYWDWNSVDTSECDDNMPAVEAKAKISGAGTDADSMHCEAGKPPGPQAVDSQSHTQDDMSDFWEWTSVETAECVNSLPVVEGVEARQQPLIGKLPLHGHLLNQVLTMVGGTEDDKVDLSNVCKDWEAALKLPIVSTCEGSAELGRSKLFPLHGHLLSQVLLVAGGSVKEQREMALVSKGWSDAVEWQPNGTKDERLT
ncbi:hypothetical protein Esti_005789 [Eimeria stiedai]